MVVVNFVDWKVIVYYCCDGGWILWVDWVVIEGIDFFCFVVILFGVVFCIFEFVYVVGYFGIGDVIGVGNCVFDVVVWFVYVYD